MDHTKGLITSIGIIGDMVGSGKSYVILSIILDPAKFASVQCTYKAFADNHVFVVTKTVRKYVKTSVIVIPHNLCKQWVAYLESFCPSLSYFIVNKNKGIAQTDWDQIDVVIVTCTMYNNFAMLHSEVIFARVFYDEADSINLPSCKKLQARFYWFVTASFRNLINPYGLYQKIPLQNGVIKTVEQCKGLKNNGYIKDLFYTIYQNPSLVKYLVVKNNDDFVCKSMSLPILTPEIVECKTPITINVLSNIVDREVIRCLNANNIRRAIKCIHPSQRASEDNIIELCLDTLKKSLKNNKLEIDFTHVLEYDDEESRQTELARLEKTKRDIESKISSITQRLREATECPICQDPFIGRTVVNCCSNSYCFKCLSTWLANTHACPLCKGEMTIKDVFVVESEQDCRPPSPCGHIVHRNNHKVTNLVNIIKTDPLKKTLVFSMHDETFESVRIALSEASISFSYLKGSSSTITSIIDMFNTGKTSVLLINPTFFGSGLNLENTTDIIMFHKLGSEMEKQVVGRANRFGRKESLKVWYLLHANEIPA